MSETPTRFCSPWTVPVFPLPNTVLFPGTLLPLHIFEPRYRSMVSDVQDGEGLIAIALMRGDGFHHIGAVGRLNAVEPLEDGRSNIVLQGLQRVTMTEIPSETPYRQVRAQVHPETIGRVGAEAVDRAKLDLLASLGLLRSVAQPSNHAALIQENVPFEVVVNTACAGLPVDAGYRQRLLETDDMYERQRQVAEHLAAVLEALSQLNIELDSGTTLN